MYRQEDIDIINKNLSTISREAAKIYLDNYEEPSTKEYEAVMKEIKEYIKKNDLIIYGGYAQNALIRAKNPDDVFYDELSRADLEIYSPDPIKHSMEMTDMLHKKGYKHVECKEGVHNETYKLFVNFLNFSDISYMDSFVFRNCPTIRVEGLRMAHPHFMLTDAYRVYADPMTSFFRLEKTFTRFSTLMKYYPFDSKAIYNKLSYKRSKENDSVLRFIRKHIIHDSNLIVIGHYAFNYLVKKESDKNAIDYNYIQLLSTDFKKDFDKINKIMKSEFKKDSSYKLHHPFFQFHDNRVEFYHKGNVVLKLYGHNERCTVYQKSDKKRTNFGTFILVMLHLLSDYNFHIINKNKDEEANYLSMLVRLIDIRTKYLEEKNLTVLDDTPFKEFTYKCIGTPVDPIRDSLLKGLKNIQAGRRVKFSYRPSGTPGKVPSFKFNNSSGLEINSKGKGKK